MRALLTLSTFTLAWLLHRSLKRVSAAIDEAFDRDSWLDDYLPSEWPAEAQFGDARNSRAGSGKADATEAQGMVALHPDGGL